MIGINASSQLNAFDKNTKMLLHFGGNNNSTIFKDSSGYERMASVSGSAIISNIQYKFNNTSGYFPDTSSYIEYTIPAIGTSDFAIEFFAYYISNIEVYLELGNYNNSDGILWHDNNVYINGSSLTLSYTKVSANTWHCFKLNRTSGTARLFIDGILVNSGSSTHNITRTDLRIGAARYSNYSALGYIDEFRLSSIDRGILNYTPQTFEFSR